MGMKEFFGRIKVFERQPAEPKPDTLEGILHQEGITDYQIVKEPAHNGTKFYIYLKTDGKGSPFGQEINARSNDERDFPFTQCYYSSVSPDSEYGKKGYNTVYVTIDTRSAIRQ